jgi:hypothetical protein
MSATHKGAIGHVVSAPAGTQFMRIVKVVDKSKRCSVCGGPSKCKPYDWTIGALIGRRSGFRHTVMRQIMPCECLCRKGLGILDPDL